MLTRILETEVMDSPEEARDYDSMDHRQVNQLFVTDFLALSPTALSILDVGTGTAQIPIELCQRCPSAKVIAVDLAEHMLALGVQNVLRAGLDPRIDLRLVDAKGLPFENQAFDAIISNSIIHHIPEPRTALAEMVRVCRQGGSIFIRDLLRPTDSPTLDRLVLLYAGDANDHQRQMFADSLRAALSLDEIRGIVVDLGLPQDSVQPTSDRHWTLGVRHLEKAKTP